MIKILITQRYFCFNLCKSQKPRVQQNNRMPLPFEFEVLVAGEWKDAILLGEYNASMPIATGAFCIGLYDNGPSTLWVRTKFSVIDDNNLEVVGNGFEPSFNVQPSITQWRRNPTAIVTNAIRVRIRELCHIEQQELQMVLDMRRRMRAFLTRTLTTAIENAVNEGIATIQQRHIDTNVVQDEDAAEAPPCVMIEDTPTGV